MENSTSETLNNLRREQLKNMKKELESVRDLNDVKKIFKLFFETNEEKRKKFILFFDAIDQLEPTSSGNAMEWMLFSFPTNFKVIYTSLKNEKFQNSIDKLRRNCGEFIKLESMSLKSSVDTFNCFLAQANRTLNHSQNNAIVELLSRVEQIYPLHIKLLYDISAKWVSYEQLPDEFIEECESIDASIRYMLRKLEKDSFSPSIVFHCLFYLNEFPNGIAESELEDILSLDDDFLTAIFQVGPNIVIFRHVKNIGRACF